MMNTLKETDPAVFDAIRAEQRRQHDELELIASENYTSAAVMYAVGSGLTNRNAGGLPERRGYGGGGGQARGGKKASCRGQAPRCASVAASQARRLTCP